MNTILKIGFILVILIILGIFIFGVYLVGQDDVETFEITNFEECITAGNPAMESYPRQCRTKDGELFVEEIEVNTNISLAEIFQKKMVEVGVKEVGQPIEGFDVFILMQAFPGLVVGDFLDVATLEGHYEIEDKKVLYIRDKDQPITSAEKTISEEGFVTLLGNVSIRLKNIVTNQSDIEALVRSLLEKKDTLSVIDCKPEQRNVDACIEIYQPVCGLVDVQCITTPCDPVFETYSNSCNACSNLLVYSYSEGECSN